MMGTLDMGDAEYADDLADIADIGAPSPRRRTVHNHRRIAAGRLIPRVAGVPARGVRLQPLGFPSVVFTAASGTVLVTSTRPQRPFKALRLVIDIARTGVTATGLVTIGQCEIGTDNQFVGTGPVIAAAFAPTAFDINVEFDPATTAIDMTIELRLSVAPTLTDTIDVGVAMFGITLG